MLGRMRGYGVDISGVMRSEGMATSCSSVMTEKDTGDRTFFLSTGRTANSALKIYQSTSLTVKFFI